MIKKQCLSKVTIKNFMKKIFKSNYFRKIKYKNFE